MRVVKQSLLLYLHIESQFINFSVLSQIDSYIFGAGCG